MKRRQQPAYKIPIDGEWQAYTESAVAALERTKPASYRYLDERIAFQQRNPLAFLLPHGRPRKDGTNDGLAFINDWENDLLLLRAPSQTGKTYLGAAKTGLFCVECNPKWPCFEEHGVICPPWTGPKIIIIASFSWENVQIVWDTYREILPVEELGSYAIGGTKTLSFANGKTKNFRLRKSGSQFIFLCYTQSIVHWESRKAHAAHPDEQIYEHQFDSLTARMRTMGDYTPIWTTQTPFVVDGRPDTGAGGWFQQKIVSGRATKGRKFAEYIITMDSVPEVFISKIEKKRTYVQFIEEPEQLNDPVAIRHGRAVYYGEPELGGGLVFSEWNPEIHVIEPFDFKKFNPTFYRLVDHGENPCAALIVAVFSWGDAVAIREHYNFGDKIGPNARKIVEDMCGNKRRDTGGLQHNDEGRTWPIMEEICEGMEFASTEMDAYSFGFKTQDSGLTVGMLYNIYGCRVSPTSAHRRGEGITLAKEWLGLVRNRKHINAHLGRPVPPAAVKYGAPRFYVFSTLQNFRIEIEGWPRNQRTNKPLDKDDHLMSCFLWFAGHDRSYFGPPAANQASAPPPVLWPSTGY